MSLQFCYVDPLSVKSVLIGSLVLCGENIKDERMRLGFIREFEMQKHIRKIKETDQLVADGILTGNQALLINAIASFSEQVLTHVNPSMFTEDAALEAFAFHPELTTKVISIFRLKFNPTKNDIEKYKVEKEALSNSLDELDTGKKKHDDRRRTIFKVAVLFVDSVLKSNVYEYHKLGMAFRLRGDFLDQVPGLDRKAIFPELPYGVFYIKSWNYIGFQLRFRELARGGMRTIVSRDAEHLKYERANAFAECYNLAFTQQMKNKDIPEGGSKAVVFLLPFDISKDAAIAEKELAAAEDIKSAEEIKAEMAKYIKAQTLEYMYYNQRCFLNTLLSMLVWDDQANKLKYGNLIDYLKQKEMIYLGPDENMHDSMIHWLAGESKRLGYAPILGAFISGKDGAGMNHKEFGVTSLGVLQYVKTCVEYLGLPEDFTVKVSGGPDGDVAGNMILLLGKHYPKSKLLTITDGFGACYDPEGMDYKQLSGMFHKVQAINKYPPELLHNGGWLLCLWETRQQSPLIKETLLYRKVDGKVVEDWIPSSQAMHMFSKNAHEHYADIFVPGGGRPRTLTMANIEDFLIEGKPSAKAMVEGANLYITGDTREYLEDLGLMIYKDSSANKCGVVSSSYEILAGLCLDDETYIRVKPELAKNVLAKLEKIAYAEAQVMLKYWLDHEKTIRLSSVSKMVSDAINKFTDQVITFLHDKDLSAPAYKKFNDVYINYVPEVLKKENMDAVVNTVPDHHKKCIIATTIACKVVYEKGIDWEPSIVDVLPVIIDQ
jgi:glutamate dehydrogenase